MTPYAGKFGGCRVVVIAGGPSVTLKAVHHIARRRLDINSDVRVIAVNDAAFVAWWADWLHACDGRWWRWNVQMVKDFRGIRTTLDDTVPRGWAQCLLNTGKLGFDPDPDNCRTGANSAYQAMHIALHAGAAEIILVGVDMDDGAHWHADYPGIAACNRPVVMLPCFDSLLPEIDRRGVRVMNASMNSRLTLWPRVAIEEALPG